MAAPAQKQSPPRGFPGGLDMMTFDVI